MSIGQKLSGKKPATSNVTCLIMDNLFLSTTSNHRTLYTNNTIFYSYVIGI